MHHFESQITDLNMSGLWKIVVVPPEIVQAMGAKARLDVRGLIDGVPFQRTLLPDGEGGHFFVTNVEMRRRIGKNTGDQVAIQIEPDDTYGVVELPDYFEDELAENPIAKGAYEKSPPSAKRWVAKYLTEVKSLEAKTNRVVKALEVLERWAAEAEAKSKKRKNRKE